MSQLKIGSLNISNHLVLAPLAGVTNLPFRLICKEQGAGLVFSEMISAEALVRKNDKTLALLETDHREDPLGFQLFGSRKETLKESVEILQTMGAKIIDLNLGCPVAKVVKSGSGAALARDPLKLEEILKEMAKAAKVPITIKLRKGWDTKSINCLEIGKMAQDCGISMVSLHGRTAKQGFQGKADWEIIRTLKKALVIPVIGNGDVNSPEEAKRMREQTGCHGVMIGRGSLGNPWIFKETLHYLKTGELPPKPTNQEQVSLMIRHMNYTMETFGKELGIKMMRKCWAHYVKGRPGAAGLRGQLVCMDDDEEICRVIRDFFQVP